MTTLPPILSLEQLATHLGCGETIIGDMARAGEVPGAFKLGRLWRFHSDLAVPHLAPRPDSVPSQWQDAAPQSAPATAAARRTGRSGGASKAASASKAATPPKRTPRTTPTSSASAFAEDFPAYARRGA